MSAAKGHKTIKESESEAIKKAKQTIASLFQTTEQLTKLDTERTKFLQEKMATEAQLKMAMHNQLNNAQDGLKRLTDAAEISLECDKRYVELNDQLSQLVGLSSSLKEVKSLGEKYNQLAAAMENMNYLVRVPEALETARSFIESDKLLDGHKIIQEVEAIRDDLILELNRFRLVDELSIVKSYFAQLDQLNEMMKTKIRIMGQRLYDVSITCNELLVDCIRVIDREERADAIWRRRVLGPNSMPEGRPKEWKKLLFQNIQQNIENQVQSSEIAIDTKNTRIAVQTVDIKQKTKRYLRLAKNILPIYFPPDYEIFNRVVEMFHNAIGKFTESCFNRTDLTRHDYGNLLSWLENYHSEDFMKDGYLNIDFEDLQLEYPVNLLNHEQRADLNRRFVKEFSTFVRNYLNGALEKEINDMRTPKEKPTCNSRGKFITMFPQFILNVFGDMVGPGKLFSIIGPEVSKQVIDAYVNLMISFASSYLIQMKSYRDSYIANRDAYENYGQFAVAHVYISDIIAQHVEEMIIKKLGEDDLMLKNKLVVGPLRTMRDRFKDVTKFCLDMLEQLLFLDLTPLLRKPLTKEWLSKEDNTVFLFTGTINDYNTGEWVHMDDKYYQKFVEKILETLLIEWLFALLTNRLPVANEAERIRIGSKIKEEGERMTRFINQTFGDTISSKIAHAYSVLKLIGSVVETRDKTLLSFDITTLHSEFPDVTSDHLMAIINIRGDFKNVEAKELLGNMERGKNSQESSLRIFHKLHLKYPTLVK